MAYNGWNALFNKRFIIEFLEFMHLEQYILKSNISVVALIYTKPYQGIHDPVMWTWKLEGKSSRKENSISIPPFTEIQTATIVFENQLTSKAPI